MTKALAKAVKNDELIRSLIDESVLGGMRVGDIYIDDEGVYHRIDSLALDKEIDWKATEEQWKKRHPEAGYFRSHHIPDKEIIKIDVIKVGSSSDGARYYKFDEWHKSGSFILSHETKVKNWVKVTDKEKYNDLALNIISGKAELPDLAAEMGQDQAESTNGLIHVSSKEYLTVMQNAAMEKKAHMMTIQHHVKRELEKKKAHLRGIMDHFGEIVAAFEKKVQKIKRLIYIIELYLGVNETILHFQEGEAASADEPISFRQRVMFMDEEVGDPRLDPYGKDEGLDFQNIEAFDDWLCANGNYKKVIPEAKCVCVFKIRREAKKGHITACGNPFIGSMMQQEDKKTYILIRNGDNLYRIWVDMEVAERLFPHKKELLELQQEVVKHERQNNHYDLEKAKDKLENDLERYQRQFILLQGLIDRTEILYPIKEVFKLSELDLDKTKLVRFIYDDGPLLTHKDHVPFKDWLKKVNSTIQEGSRVVITDNAEREEERFDNRFYTHRDSKYNLPSVPDKGLYTVHLKKTPENNTYANPKGYGERVKEMLTIRYNPGDEVINYWDRYDRGHERKNNISYNITIEDDFILNFDEVTVERIDYYLDSRLDRRNYLRMMPILWEVREQKRKEREEEQDFLLMIIAPFAGKASQEVLLAAANEEMLWWKTKNKWKRGLKKDDAKAFRMIGNKLKKRFK